MWTLLTHLFQCTLSLLPENIIIVSWCFQEVEKVCIGIKWAKAIRDIIFFNFIRQDLSCRFEYFFLWQCNKYIRDCSFIIQGGYPARLKNVFIISAPIWFRASLAVLSSFLKDKIRDRVRIHNAVNVGMHL